MLVEEGFQVVSIDASDKMLKYALRQRWKRRKDPAFNNWSKYNISITLLTIDRQVAWCSGRPNTLVSINVVALQYYMDGWVTVSRQVYRIGTYPAWQPHRSTQPSIPPV